MISIGSEFAGSVNKENNHAIYGSVFDGDVAIWNRNTYQQMMHSEKDSKYFMKEAKDRFLTRKQAIEAGLYKEPLWAGNDYPGMDNQSLMNQRNAIIAEDAEAVKKAFDNASNVVVKNDKQSYDLPQDTGSSSSYYKLTSSDSNNFTINLYNFGGNQDEPVYIYIPNDYPSINIQLHEDIVRPIIFCYFGKMPSNPWYTPPDTRTTIRFMNAYEVEYKDKKGNIKKRLAYASFRGSIYTPTAKIEPFSYEYGNFTGSLYADKIQFNSNHANFKFEEFSLPGGGGGSGTPAVKPRLVDNSLW